MFDLHVIYRAAMLSQLDTTGTLYFFFPNIPSTYILFNNALRLRLLQTIIAGACVEGLFLYHTSAI